MTELLGGKYEIKKEIAQGGMGVVYLAYDHSLLRDVAVKKPHAKFCNDDEFVARFIREGRTMALLDHNNIVQIHEVFKKDKVPYLVMQYIQADNLKNHLFNKNTFGIEDFLSIAIQITDSVRYSHSKGVIHRDIKLANILINEMGTIKLTDFGIAAAAGATRITEVGAVMGSTDYMSPEQALGLQVDIRTDIYSLGVVFYQLFTGKIPVSHFTGELNSICELAPIQKGSAPLYNS